jgi:peptidoglycan/LPS O-acetylase OafA/YrhL
MSADSAKTPLWIMFALLLGLVLFGAALGLALGSAYEQSSLKWLLMALALIAAAGSAIALFDISRWSRSQLTSKGQRHAPLATLSSGVGMLGAGLLTQKPFVSTLAIVVGVIACAAGLAQVVELVRERGRKPEI